MTPDSLPPFFIARMYRGIIMGWRAAGCERRSRRVNQVAAELLGQCLKSLEDVSTEQERTLQFLRELDDLVMECQQCNWWVDADEVDDDQHCEDCAD